MSYQGHVQNGVVVLDEPLALPNGTPVLVAPIAAPDSFWQPLSLEELARRQGVKGIPSPDELRGGWPSDEVNDGFDGALSQWRARESA